MKQEQVWHDSRERLLQSLDNHRFNMWIKPLRVSPESDDRLLVLETPNQIAKKEIESSDILPLIRNVVTETAGRTELDVRINFVPQNGSSGDSSLSAPSATGTLPSPSVQPAPDSTRNDPPRHRLMRRRLIDHFTFDRYIVGNGNQFAHAAAKAVADGSRSSSMMTRLAYNPLFIYGGVGLGKTHLLNAIGHELLKLSPKMRVVYASGEDFTNDVITALQTRRTEELRRLYRHECDLLLIDDIQFIADKDATQNEFFHVFDELYSANKQIVLTCDKHPDELKGIEERIISRFEWGLTADVKPPDIETKLAILKAKADEYRFHMPDDVMLFLAKHCGVHMRELEGSLTKVIAHCSMTREAPSLDRIAPLFRPVVVELPRKPTIEAIIRQVSTYYDVSYEEILSRRRFRHLALARQVAMYMCRELTDASFPMIGTAFGGKDHTTVMYAVDQMKFRRENDDDFQHQLEIIKQRILGS